MAHPPLTEVPASPDDTGGKQAVLRFKPGQSGNPAGRPRGARSKLGEDFLKAIQEDFAAHGVEAIQRVRTERPDVYLKVVASILPRESKLTIDDKKRDATDWTRAELVAFLNSATNRKKEPDDSGTGTAH